MASRDDIVAAAFRLFDSAGYDATSADDIAAAAGVSRSTFFRSFGSKEAVVFPDHDELLERVGHRLGSSPATSALSAVTDAVKIVLLHYVAEGEHARTRYRLTSTVPVLRDRELAGTARYQRLFRSHLSQWGDGTEASELHAEVTSAAVVAAHNHVLRRWLRGECADPHDEVARALAVVHRTFDAPAAAPAAVVVVPAGTSMEAVAQSVRAALGSG